MFGSTYLGTPLHSVVCLKYCHFRNCQHDMEGDFYCGNLQTITRDLHMVQCVQHHLHKGGDWSRFQYALHKGYEFLSIPNATYTE